MAARASNPTLPAQCGLSVAIVLDLSNSLSNSDVIASKNAANAVVTSLQGTPSSVGVFTFATYAPDGTNVAKAKTSISTDNGANSVKAAINGITRVPSSVGGTNWDAALRQVPQGQYDIVLFVTDGNPTAYGTPNSKSNSAIPVGNTDFGTKFDNIDLSTAVAAADALKARGTFIMGLAVGSDVNAENIQQISGTTLGTDYFTISNYEQLAAQLAKIALKNCEGTVSIVKQVRNLQGDLSSAGGWTFSGREGDKVSPQSAVTDAVGGAVNFKINDLLLDTRTVQFTEVQQEGYTLETQGPLNATCENKVTGKNVPVTNAGVLGFKIDVKRDVAVACLVINKMIPSIPIIKKSSDPVSGTKVKPGQTVKYKLTFSNEGFFPADVDHVDHLADILDDANFNNDIKVVGGGVTASLSGAKNDQIQVKGSVGPKKTVTVTYSVTVKTSGFGNGTAKNFLVPKGTPPPAVCDPKTELCTEHPIPGALVTTKSSDPEPGSYVAPGSIVKYTLSFANSGASPVAVDHIDHLSDVFDDAVFKANSLIVGDGLSAVLSGDQLKVTGKVPKEATLTVSYSVTVKTQDFGNGVARNFLVPKGDKPECDPKKENCTEHPVLGSLLWQKVDDASQALSGSEWKLTGPGIAGSKPIKDCISQNAAGCAKGGDRNPAAGGFELKDLPWGDYTLVETRAPAGYLLDETVHKFSIGAEEGAVIVKVLGPLTNTQQPALSLPLTGGLGSQAFFIGGGVALIAALALGARSRRKEVTRDL